MKETLAQAHDLTPAKWGLQPIRSGDGRSNLRFRLTPRATTTVNLPVMAGVVTHSHPPSTFHSDLSPATGLPALRCNDVVKTTLHFAVL